MRNVPRLIFGLILCLGFGASASAQFSKTVHHTFPAEGISAISIDIAGNVAVESWAGDAVLVQTDIRLFNASKGIFTYLVEQSNRYGVEALVSGQSMAVASTQKQRDPIMTKKGQCTEEINVKVLVPKSFTGSGTGPYTRELPDAGR